MKEKFDPSKWFDLKNYDGLSGLDLLGWHRQISIRNLINHILFSEIAEETRDLLTPEEWAERINNSKILKLIERIKHNPIIESCDEYEGFEVKELSCLEYPFDTHSVKSTPASSMHFLGTDELLSDVWNCCDILMEEMIVTSEQAKLMETPYDLLCKDRGNNKGYTCIVETEGYAHLTVDLSVTNAKIREDFKHWLTEYKKTIKYESTKTIFAKNDLSRWVDQRLLPCFDLVLIAKIEDKWLTIDKLAEYLFEDNPDEGSDEKVRITRKTNAEELMQDETLFAIQTQLNSAGLYKKKTTEMQA